MLHSQKLILKLVSEKVLYFGNFFYLPLLHMHQKTTTFLFKSEMNLCLLIHLELRQSRIIPILIPNKIGVESTFREMKIHSLCQIFGKFDVY